MCDYIRAFSKSLSMALIIAGTITACGDEADRSSANIVADYMEAQSPLFGMNQLYWGQGVIRVCWENSLPNASTMYWVRDQVGRTWEKNANVHFYGWNVCESANQTSRAVHIAIDDSNPRTVGYGYSIQSSRPGMYLDNTFVNWSPSCQSSTEFCQRAIAAHEFGHVLGYRHEQDRPETNSTPAYAAACSNAGYPNPAPYNGNDATEYLTWDLNSIMNYCNPSWNNAGNLSSSDISGSNSTYGTYLSKIRENLGTGAPYLNPNVAVFLEDMDGDHGDDLVYVSVSNTASGNVEIDDYWGGSNFKNYGWHTTVPNEPQTSDFAHHAYGIADVDNDNKADLIHYIQTGANVQVQTRTNASNFASFSWNTTTTMPSAAGSKFVQGHTSGVPYQGTGPSKTCQIRTDGQYYAARCFYDPSYNQWHDYGDLPISSSTPCNWFIQGGVVDGNTISADYLVCMTSGASNRTEAWIVQLSNLLSNPPPPALIGTIPLPMAPSTFPQFRFFPTTRGTPGGDILPPFNVKFHIGVIDTSSTSSGKTEYFTIDAGQIF